MALLPIVTDETAYNLKEVGQFHGDLVAPIAEPPSGCLWIYVNMCQNVGFVEEEERQPSMCPLMLTINLGTIFNNSIFLFFIFI